MSQVPAGGNASFRRKGAEAILGFTRQNRDPHAAFRIRGMGDCRIPSLCKGPVVSSWLKQQGNDAGWLAAWGTDLVALDTLFVERLASAFLPTPPIPTHTFELLCVSWRFLSRLPAELPLQTTAPRRYPVDHSIRSMHEKPCGPVNGKIPPKLPVPRILEVVKSMRPPSLRTTRCAEGAESQCRLPTLGIHPHPSRRNSKRSNTAFRPFLDVIKL